MSIVKLTTNLISISWLCLTTFFTQSVAASPTLSDSQILAILNDRERIQIIDRLPTEDRHSLLADVRKRLQSPNTELMVKILCGIEPWSLGNEADDYALQVELFETLSPSAKPWSDTFEAADCAAANKYGSYFSLIPRELQRMEEAFTESDGAKWVNADSGILLATIRRVDAPLIRAIERNDLRSFFPLLNSQLSAQIHAARAVQKASLDEEGAIESFRAAAQSIQEWNGAPEYYRTARNGYRYRNDMQYHESFYLALSGDETALDRLREMVEWPALAADQEVSAILPASVKSKLTGENSEYVDPIYFGRLLPGAATNPLAEADRWWNTSYPTRDLAAVTVSCFEKYWAFPLVEMIGQLDDCIARFDPADWRVELASFRGSANQTERAEREKRRLLDNIFASRQNTALEQFTEDFHTVFRGNRWYIQTDQKYSRKEILMFRRGLERVRGNPQYVFFRQSVF